MNKEFEKASELIMKLYEHLEYCGWGDSWERECSGKLRDEASDFLEALPPNHPYHTTEGVN